MFYTVIFQYAIPIYLNFFSFAFLRKPFRFPFHFINYLPILTLVLASVCWGLGGGARVWKIWEVLQIFLHYSVLEEKQCRSMEKKKENTFFFLSKCGVLLLLLDQNTSLVSLVSLVMKDHQGAIMCSHTCHVV